MMRKLVYTAAAVAAMMLTGCSKNEPPKGVPPQRPHMGNTPEERMQDPVYKQALKDNRDLQARIMSEPPSPQRDAKLRDAQRAAQDLVRKQISK